jgi:hypothetical protein
MAVNFLAQAQLRYPGNADVSENINALGESISKSLKEGRNRNKLLRVSEAVQKNNLEGGVQAALAEGDVDLALKIGTLAATKDRAGQTDDLKELAAQNRVRAEKGLPPIEPMDWIRGNKAAGATRVNVQSGERSYDQKVGGAYGDFFVEGQKAGRTASGQLLNLGMMEKLVDDPSFYSGAGAERFVLPLKQTISSLGGDANSVKDSASAMETFRSLASKSALDAMGGSLGAGFSNADRDFVINQVPNLSNTPEGNKRLIAVQRALAQRTRDIAELQREWVKRNGRLDEKFDAQLSDWAERTPLFKAEAGASPQTPQAGGARGAPPVAGARMGNDGKFYVPDPQRPGKYLRVD